MVVLALAIVGSAVAAFASSGPGSTTTASATVNGANNLTVSLTIPQGGLSVYNEASNPPASVTLDGNDHTAYFTLPINVTDARGTGAGWSVSISATTFVSTDAHAYTLSTGSPDIGDDPIVCKPSSASCNTSTAALPTGATQGTSFQFTTPNSTPSQVLIATAALNTGMASYTITPKVEFPILANAYADSMYQSTVTVTTTLGPS